MRKQKEITIEEYNKRMNKIVKRDMPPHEALILMLNEASKYRIKEKK